MQQAQSSALESDLIAGFASGGCAHELSFGQSDQRGEGNPGEEVCGGIGGDLVRQVRNMNGRFVAPRTAHGRTHSAETDASVGRPWAM